MAVPSECCKWVFVGGTRTWSSKALFHRKPGAGLAGSSITGGGGRSIGKDGTSTWSSKRQRQCATGRSKGRTKRNERRSNRKRRKASKSVSPERTAGATSKPNF